MSKLHVDGSHWAEGNLQEGDKWVEACCSNWQQVEHIWCQHQFKAWIGLSDEASLTSMTLHLQTVCDHASCTCSHACLEGSTQRDKSTELGQMAECWPEVFTVKTVVYMKYVATVFASHTTPVPNTCIATSSHIRHLSTLCVPKFLVYPTCVSTYTTEYCRYVTEMTPLQLYNS